MDGGNGLMSNIPKNSKSTTKKKNEELSTEIIEKKVEKKPMDKKNVKSRTKASTTKQKSIVVQSSIKSTENTVIDKVVKKEEIVKDVKVDKIKNRDVEIKTLDIVKTDTDLKNDKVKTKQVAQKAENKTKTKVAKKTETKKIDKSEITSYNTYLFHQGNNYEAYNIMGSHIKTENRKKGTQFATWAPNAQAVFVVGDFNNFESDESHKLKKISENGIWSGFFTDVKEGAKYKYCIIDKNGKKGELKSDPYAIKSEVRPNTASIVYNPKAFRWGDSKWIKHRNSINVLEQPLNIYEIHLGSWKQHEDGTFLTYEELSEELPKYLKEMNYSHVEIMPLAEHPLDASWGYQGTGFYSPTSRYGDLEGLKKLINKLHVANIGVIMDWAPGHFCKDAHGLYKFAGEATYEYQEEWKADNKDWGTNSFDLGRPEVKSFLISNALYWFREFHIDGLRVDAVSSILYLDYSKNEGEWIPNKYGDNGNLEAMQFLKDLNTAVFKEFPTALMIAEESTAWPNITKPVNCDGLGFNFKWNMGWMNDTLEYVELNPEYRQYHHRNVTFAMMYNYAENYVLPLSHDEVVHGKKSVINKMWGDEWNKFAGLRAFISYMIGHPGKKLTFMGCEFAQDIEWREYEGLKWNLIKENEMNKKTQIFFRDINKIYMDNKALWELDHNYKGFNWIEVNNNMQSVLIFDRRSRNDDETLVFVVNFKSEVYYDYQIGVPFLAEYEELINTDDEKYGGSGQVMGTIITAEEEPYHNQPYSIKIKVPPMATLVLRIKKMIKANKNTVEEKDNN